jgi:hypothetical protein
MFAQESDAAFGPWNPGIESDLPREFLPLSTMFRPENVSTSVAEAQELADFTGLAPHDLVAFRPERLAVHELLIRVMADLNVPDGRVYGDLGINFRDITGTILSRYIEPRMADIVRVHGETRQRAARLIDDELAATIFAASTPAPAAAQRRGLFAGLRRGAKGSNGAPPATSVEENEMQTVADWRRKVDTADDPLRRSVYDALITVVTAIKGKRGRVLGDRALLVALATDIVGNTFGSDVVGETIAPLVRQAVNQQGYRVLPPQDRPVVMNVKGASASGKSTLRPLQRKLAEKIGVEWHDFALISPDIWRKFLLDYDSLGAAAKYAGTLTGHEVAIIDRKLDRYMAAKAKGGGMTHLLVDRFRFDSFATREGEEEGGRLLTRFGDLVYMFFMITPPDATVERAWKRGLEFGRYKAVDDLLDHNVEAYTGMPRLYFTWAAKTDKRVHCEFLDNSVPLGTAPRTIAFGWNGELNVLDIKCLLDVDRFRKINIHATGPDQVYGDPDSMAPERNTEFLRLCAATVPVINFLDQATGRPYARLEGGKLTALDPARFAAGRQDSEARAGFDAITRQSTEDPSRAEELAEHLQREHAHTLGAWGPPSPVGL